VAAGLRGIVDGNYFEGVPEAIATTRAGYESVGEAIRSRDADAAVRAYQDMMVAHGDNAVAMMSNRGLLVGD
jgi:hypothetical protein